VGAFPSGNGCATLNNYALPAATLGRLFHGAIDRGPGKKLIFSAFDPLTGKARQVLHSRYPPRRTPITGCRRRMPRAWFLSSSTPWKADPAPLPQGRSGARFVVKDGRDSIPLDWAADGRSLFVSSQSATSSTLLNVDLEGHAIPLWDQRGAWRTWAIAAPNGRELASPA